MLKIKKINYKNNTFISNKQFLIHNNIYLSYLNKLNNYLNYNNIKINNKFELIDFLYDLPELKKNYFSNLLGSVINHEYFFSNLNFLKNKCFGETLNLLKKKYNSLENFFYNFLNILNNFNGWGWVVINNNNINIVKTYENNNPLFPVNLGGYNSVPLLCIDLHEHSYIFDYIDKKDYIKNFLDYINWFEVENRLQNYFLNK